MLTRAVFRWVILFVVLTLGARAEIQVAAEKPTPNRIRPVLLVLSPEWPAQIPPTGRVNVPAFFSTLYPGQKIAVGFFAEGPDRAKAFDGVTIEVSFAVGSTAAKTVSGLKPRAVRAIKAEGADVALMALKAGGIAAADLAKMEESTALVTLAVFVPEWEVPATEENSEVAISARVTGTASPVTIETEHLKIRSTKDWLAGPAPTVRDLGQKMNHYQADLAPGELMTWFVAVVKGGSLKSSPLHAFFAFAFKSNPAAREAAVAAYPVLDAESQGALLWVLRLAGCDLASLFPALPAETIARFKVVEPLADPRHLRHFEDPVDPEALKSIGGPMDQCWSGWMATGDPGFLRPLVDLLANAPDYPALKAWQESRSGAKGLTARAANGLAYQIAGWSIGSFQRTDPRVADWLLYWQTDPAVPAVIRQEIATLLTNPAFRRK